MVSFNMGIYIFNYVESVIFAKKKKRRQQQQQQKGAVI